jgi:hypothetical protein
MLKYEENKASTLEYKKYKHLCYLFELFYVIPIEPKCNLTENPTCEWQLRVYSSSSQGN